MDIKDIINLSVNFSALAITLTLLVITSINSDLKKGVNRWFFLVILFNFIGLISEIMIWGFVGHPGKTITVLIRVLDGISYSVSGIQIICFAMYLHEYLKLKIKLSKKIFVLLFIIGCADVLLSISAQFLSLYSVLDGQNNYYSLDTAFIALIFPLASFLIFIGIAVRNRSKLEKQEWLSLVAYPAAPFLCYIIEFFTYGIWLAFLGASISLLLIYMNIQMDLKRQMQIQKEELADNRIALMLSQIKPHFLYNTLSAIDRLCYETPKAHEAIITFSEYLRSNMDALTRKHLIPFEEELQHTEKYLWLEKLRFDDELEVIYDIKTKDFMIPVLTVQPIVENAVRHGVTKTSHGGTVELSTAEEKDCFLITIRDNGRGFDFSSKPEDSRSHLGISNVRARLFAMCRGELEISSEVGKGTIAVIRLPKSMN